MQDKEETSRIKVQWGSYHPGLDLLTLDLRYLTKDRLIVWWLGGLVKARHDNTQPKTLVLFREIDENGVLGRYRKKRIGVAYLGLMQIGSIWHDGRCIGQASYSTRTYDVDFGPNGWGFCSHSSSYAAGHPPPFPVDTHPLGLGSDPDLFDPAWLLRFDLGGNGGKLLIPCMTFFSRCYGRSQEIKRVLLTYPWEEAEQRFFAPLPEDFEPQPGTWPVCLNKRMINTDATFLAHAKHDAYTRKQTKLLWAQSEALNYQANNFLKVAPWFSGPAKIEVSGIAFDHGQGFLALQVGGCSDPDGPIIERDRENTRMTGPADEETELRGTVGVEKRLSGKYMPEIIDLTAEQDPDRGGYTIEIHDPGFKVLGTPRAVIDHRRDRTRSTGGSILPPGEVPDTFSAGDPYGGGKGVGRADIRTQVVMESEGVLRDMWNALKRFEIVKSDLVKSVQCYTFEKGLFSSEHPELVAFPLYDDKQRENLNAREKNWPYLDVASRQPRGALLVGLETPKGMVFILEMQRRPRTKKDKDGKECATEESFKGMIFRLTEHESMASQIGRLLDLTRSHCGVMGNIASTWPCEAGAFKHMPSRKENIPCERAVILALKKLGIAAYSHQTPW